MLAKLSSRKFSILLTAILLIVSSSSSKSEEEVFEVLDSRYEFNDPIFDQAEESTTDLTPTTDNDNLPTEPQEPTTKLDDEPTTTPSEEEPTTETTDEFSTPSTTAEATSTSYTSTDESSTSDTTTKESSTSTSTDESSTTDEHATEPDTATTLETTTGESSTPRPGYHFMDSCDSFDHYNALGFWLFSTGIPCEADLPPDVPEPPIIYARSQSDVGYKIAKYNEATAILVRYDGKENYAAFTFTYYSTVDVLVTNAFTDDGSDELIQTNGNWSIRTMTQNDMKDHVSML